MSRMSRRVFQLPADSAVHYAVEDVHEEQRETHTQERHNPYRSWNVPSIDSRYEQSYDDTDLLSSPTPLPRQSNHSTIPRMLSISERDFSHHLNENPKGYYPFEDNTHRKNESRPSSHRDMRHNFAPQISTAKLVPVSNLPDWCHGIFQFGLFNAMQSQCFATAINTDSNMVISAPTGAGKTVLFELAIIKLLQSSGRAPDNGSKCVYMAPTKAICSERSRDWTTKFLHVGVKCCELTGDTMVTGKQAWRQAKDCAIIITTPEKWDSLTRNWNDSSNFLQQIKLFMVDEVHTVSEAARGSCLEVVVSRMMQRGNSVRFVLLSATAPNIEDIKDWLSSCSSGEPTKMFKFGDEFRPCKLKRFVYGFPRTQGHNDFQFMKTLDFKLFPIVQEHSSGKPILVFCPTRKGVMSTTTHLMEECQKVVDAKQSLPWDVPDSLDVTFSDPQLHAFAKLGLGAHHAGLSREDRRMVEELFIQRKLYVIVSTSTLAVGVNFPAHAVIIKGVMQWAGDGWAEYSSQDVMQMLGRAGRPQFDREGVAVIMCENHLKSKYHTLSTGGSNLESTLHGNLIEHINSEIGLGTIGSIDTAKQWLRNTFLFRRIQKNPSHYNVSVRASDEATWEECMDDLVTSSLCVLQETQLVETGTNKNELIVTNFGEIMSRYYIRQTTMKSFIETANANEVCLRSTLLVISGAEEFKNTHMRVGERQVYQKLSEHESIRFPIKKAETSTDKVSLLIQAILGGVSLMSADFKSLNSQPQLEALNVMRYAPRMIAALVDVALVTRNGAVVINAMSLMRSLNAKAWEDRPVALKQIEGIGDKSFKVLAENGIAKISSLSMEDPYRIEMLLNRRPPFGSDVISAVRSLPKYSIFIKELSRSASGSEGPIDLTVSIFVSVKVDLDKSNRFSSAFDVRGSSILTVTSDNQFVDFRRTSTKSLVDTVEFSVTASLTKPSQTIVVFVSPVKFAGLLQRFEFKPSIPANTYPTLDTRPPKTPKCSSHINIIEGPDEDVLDLTDFKPAGPSSAVKTKDDKGKGMHTESKNIVTAEKRKLQNGNYACHHKCKDKTTCRHICCREGLPKPPPSPKRVKAKLKEPLTLSSPSYSSSKSKGVSEKQKNRLDERHVKATNGGTGIKYDSLAHLMDDLPAFGTTGQFVDSLLADPDLSKQDDFSELTSDQELPDPRQVQFNKKERSVGSPDSYDDSEIDVWASNIPSEVLDVDEDGSMYFPVSERHQPSGRSAEPMTSALHKGIKRSTDCVEGKVVSRYTAKRARKFDQVINLETPVHKKDVLQTPPTSSFSASQNEVYKPLFRPVSSSPSPLTQTPSKTPQALHVVHGSPRAQPTLNQYDNDVEHFLDEIFDGVEIIPANHSSDNKLLMGPAPPNPNLANSENVPVFQSKTQAHSVKSPISQVTLQTRTFENKANAKEDKQDDDPMAELNAWLDENGL